MAFREKPFSPSFPINLAVVTSSVQAIAGVIVGLVLLPYFRCHKHVIFSDLEMS